MKTLHIALVSCLCTPLAGCLDIESTQGAALKIRICPSHGCGPRPVDSITIPDEDVDPDGHD